MNESRTITITMSKTVADQLEKLKQRFGGASDAAVICGLIRSFTLSYAVESLPEDQKTTRPRYAVIRSPQRMSGDRCRGYIDTGHGSCSAAVERYNRLMLINPEMRIGVVRVEWTDGVVAQGPVAPAVEVQP
jgi:hypothetical protein